MEILAGRIRPGKIIDIFLDSLHLLQKLVLIHGMISPHTGKDWRRPIWHARRKDIPVSWPLFKITNGSPPGKMKFKAPFPLE